MKIARAAYISPEQLARCAPGSPLLRIAMRGRARVAQQSPEHQQQAKLFEWIRAHESEMPDLKLAYAITNFAGRVKSKRLNQLNGARLNAEGRRKGMLDVCWPVARLGFHGLYLEMKTEAGSLSKEQRWYRDALRGAGQCVYVPRSWEHARDFILAYYDGSYL